MSSEKRRTAIFIFFKSSYISLDISIEFASLNSLSHYVKYPCIDANDGHGKVHELISSANAKQVMRLRET